MGVKKIMKKLIKLSTMIVTAFVLTVITLLNVKVNALDNELNLADASDAGSKFHDGVKAQAKEENGTYAVRFVIEAEVNKSDDTYALIENRSYGFQVVAKTDENSQTFTHTSEYYFKTILSGENQVTPTDGYLFVTYVLNNIPASLKDALYFEVTPYALDGSVATKADTRTICLNYLLGEHKGNYKLLEKQTLYTEGHWQDVCPHCGEIVKDVIEARRANFTEDFSLLASDNNPWLYGYVNYTWGEKESFDFIAFTNDNLNEGNDGFVSGGSELKADWINASGMTTIGYKATQSIRIGAVLQLSDFGSDTTKIDVRTAVKDANGVLKTDISYDGGATKLVKYFELAEGDTVYFIFSNGNGGDGTAYPNARLSLVLKPVIADYNTDFGTDNSNWGFADINYSWGDVESFTATAFTANETRKFEATSFNTSGGMAAITYTAKVACDVTMFYTNSSSAYTRIQIIAKDGTLRYTNPNFYNPGSITEAFTLNEGDTVYIILDSDAEGSISISLVNNN